MSSIVVADAGPLHYLALVDYDEILPQLFERVLLPPAVVSELSHAAAPEKVRRWISEPKPWLRVEAVCHPHPIAGLHPGEAEALQLALHFSASAVLIDDLDGRLAARRLGIAVIGTIGLLERAAEKNLISLPDALERLKQTSFFASPQLLQAALERDRLRKNQ